MDFIGERYYKLNKILLNSLGLWPSNCKTRPIKLELILCSIILLPFLFVQLCVLITSEYNLELTLNVLSHMLPTFIYVVKYYAYYFNANKIKIMMDEIRNDWNALNDKKEIEILEKYTHKMNIYTISLTLFMCVCMIIFIFIEYLPIILDIVVPLNETRPRSMHVIAEYFVNFEKYFLLMLLHEIVATTIGIITIVATGTITLAYAEHSCGMLKIVRFIENIVSTFTISYSILICVGVASLSINLYRLLLPSTLKNIKDLFTTVMLVIGHFIYMFIANYMGQKITDHNVDIFNTTCNVSWYIAPLSSQKILLFVMQGTIKDFRLVLARMFVASLEGFSMLFTKSMSYVTAIYSLQ
ncbi:uncharacterized protein [Anoplolepis gracilipes]|uniref:uncharacterized protein isoform X2 n=1 Tax=Anoplolepis gracilipes TaxID=354296 RepID=UPI003B9F2179